MLSFAYFLSRGATQLMPLQLTHCVFTTSVNTLKPNAWPKSQHSLPVKLAIYIQLVMPLLLLRETDLQANGN